jgi:uncharacterized protein with von Willebrand factor type A (vWA) domain
MGIADARRYKPYRSDLVLDVRQIEVALRKLRAFRREGVPDELDLDETIDKTSKNGRGRGSVMRPERRPRVRGFLLMDLGGSRDPHAHLVSKLFSATRRASNIRELKTYYFHNCIYGRLYATERFLDPIPVREVLDGCPPEWKLVMVGDAAMHPGELLGSGDWDYYASHREGENMPGVRWMMLLADHFHRSVWLNPDDPNYWRGGTAETLGRVFSMFPLTIEGLGEAITHLSRGEPRRS